MFQGGGLGGEKEGSEAFKKTKKALAGVGWVLSHAPDWIPGPEHMPGCGLRP